MKTHIYKWHNFLLFFFVLFCFPMIETIGRLFHGPNFQLNSAVSLSEQRTKRNFTVKAKRNLAKPAPAPPSPPIYVKLVVPSNTARQVQWQSKASFGQRDCTPRAKPKQVSCGHPHMSRILVSRLIFERNRIPNQRSLPQSRCEFVYSCTNLVSTNVNPTVHKTQKTLN